MNNDTEGLNLDISKTTPLVCKCGNHTFEQGVFLREISALLSPTGKAGIIPVPTFCCNACGAVPDKVLPPFIRTEAAAKLTETSKAETSPITKGHLTLVE
jgi:hypothetical protein